MNKQPYSGEYNDIIRHHHEGSLRHKRMSRYDRAAQFASFAALIGYSDGIAEADRLTERRRDPDEETSRKINTGLQRLLSAPAGTIIQIRYFVPDPYKDGGRYLEKTGSVKQLDLCHRWLVFSDDTRIPIDDLADLEDGYRETDFS